MTLAGRGDPIATDDAAADPTTVDRLRLHFDRFPGRSVTDDKSSRQAAFKNQMSLARQDVYLPESRPRVYVNHRAKKRGRVWLNRFPMEMSRRVEEDALLGGIPYPGIRRTRRRGRLRRTDPRPTRFLLSESFPDDLPCRRNPEQWMLQPCLDESEAVQASSLSRKTNRCIPSAPQSFVVQVEPIIDCEDPNPCMKQDYLVCNKYYYVFERKPYRLRFLDYVRQPPQFPPPTECPRPPLLKSPLPMRLSMPAFRCTPPECREVLFCKYFQCTSLGFFPDVRNCRKYFFCDLNSNGFVLYHMLCPTGHVFDPRIRECRLKEMMGKRASPLERRRIKKDESDGDIIYAPTSTSFVKMTSEEDADDSEMRSESEINVRHKVKSAKDSPNRKTTEETTAATTTNETESGSRDVGILTQGTTATKMTTATTTTMSPTSFETEIRSSSMTSTTTMITTSTMRSVGNATSRRSDADDMGGLDSDVYQEDMREGEYDDGEAYDDDDDYYYYDGNGSESDGDGQYRVKQRFDHYVDDLSRAKVPTSWATPFTTESVTSTVWNDSGELHEKASRSFLNQHATGLPESDFERGKRSDKNGTTKEAAIEASSSSTAQASTDLPDFEKIYKETKRRNLDGYPCKKYARFPDKFDRESYYECGAQPDGQMRIEHKRCIQGEEFSPEFLECIATEYLKATHRKRRRLPTKFPKFSRKQKSKSEPEYTYEDDKELSNEWLDANHGTKVPNEFKSKSKQTLRIFHLHCKRNTTTGSGVSSRPKPVRSAASDLLWNPDSPQEVPKGKTSKRRSFTVRSNKKDAVEQQESIDDEEEDEYDEDDEEEYEDTLQDVEPKNERKAPRDEKTKMESSSYGSRSSSMETTESGLTATVPDATSTSTKVLLDADIRVNREFQNTLRNILGNGDEGENAGRLSSKRDKDSIVITLSGEKSGFRNKRNAFKSLFKKKSKNSGDDPDKEGVVSMINLINGLPSEYERDALIQKLERRKMMNSHMYKSRQRAMTKRSDDEATFSASATYVP